MNRDRDRDRDSNRDRLPRHGHPDVDADHARREPAAKKTSQGVQHRDGESSKSKKKRGRGSDIRRYIFRDVER